MTQSSDIFPDFGQGNCPLGSRTKITVFFAVLNGTSTTKENQNLSNFHVTPRTGHADRLLGRQPQKTSSPLASVSLHALQLYHCSTGFPNVWLVISAILTTLMNLATTLCCCLDPTTLACLSSKNVTLQSGLHTATFFIGRQACFRSIRCSER